MNQSIAQLVRIELTDNQLLALESFIQDQGEEIFKNSSLLKAINRNDLAAVPTELIKWTMHNGRHDPQLAKLREKEIALFTK